MCYPVCGGGGGGGGTYKISIAANEGRKEMFDLTMHSTHFIYDYLASGIWRGPIQPVKEETRCCHYMGYSFGLATGVLLHVSCQKQDNTYHDLCYTSRGSLTEKRNSSMGPP